MSKVIIVGAGLVGSLLSVYLARRGHLIDIYERHFDPRLRPPGSGRSINLTLCERGLRALDRVGAADRVKRLTIPAYGRIIHFEDSSTTYQPYGNQGEAIYSISRNKLNREMLRIAEEEPGVTLHFGEACRDVDLDGPRVLVRNRETGKERYVEAERVFGADGAHSAVRGRLQRAGRFEFSQSYVEQGYTELRLPAAPDGSYQLDKNALHVWPRGQRMLISFANLDGSTTVALHLPFEGEDSFESINDEEQLLALFRRLFPDAVPLMPNLAEDYFSHPAMPMVTVRCSPWTYGDRVALIGDAAHAIVPSYGQGANCGFEDCSVLADCLDDAGGDWGTALGEYERRRIPNAEAMADLALKHFYELQEHVADPEFLLRKRVERRIDELYLDGYVSLYSMISFTGMPYIEALAVHGEWRAVVDRLMGMEGAEEMLDRGEMDSYIREGLAEARLGATVADSGFSA